MSLRLTSAFQMTCIAEDFDVEGDFNSKTAQNLMVTFETCDEAKMSTCKSRETIQSFLDSNYILLMEN